MAVVQVPTSCPVSAASPDFFAPSIVARALPPDVGEHVPEVVTDCMAVLLTHGDLVNHDRYSSKYAGLWREPGTARVGKCTKVPAHLTEEHATQRRHGAHWHGNDRADFWAKDTL